MSKNNKLTLSLIYKTNSTLYSFNSPHLIESKAQDKVQEEPTPTITSLNTNSQPQLNFPQINFNSLNLHYNHNHKKLNLNLTTLINHLSQTIISLISNSSNKYTDLENSPSTMTASYNQKILEPKNNPSHEKESKLILASDKRKFEPINSPNPKTINPNQLQYFTLKFTLPICLSPIPNSPKSDKSNNSKRKNFKISLPNSVKKSKISPKRNNKYTSLDLLPKTLTNALKLTLISKQDKKPYL